VIAMQKASTMAELRRIYAPPESFEDGRLLLEGERLRHVRTVLRLRVGDELCATDGAGGEYRVRVEQIGRGIGRAVILERSRPQRESPLETVLAQSIPKGDRFALALEKAVELGVSRIIPVLSRRTVRATRADEAAFARWRRIVESAVAQSGRTRLPVVHPPLPLEELLATEGRPGELRLFLWEQADSGLHGVIEASAVPRTVIVAVGPEGGWSAEEARLAQDAGYRSVRLGPRILRTETAGIAAIGVLQHRWGDLG
jgi:16S rRNA (uracil1498-N3)-methyltransferase